MKIKWLCRPLGRLFCCLISIVVAAGPGFAQAPATTAIHDIIYRADGTPASGAAVISWPAFTTADQKPVPAGSLSVQIGAGGSFAVALAPNVNATPAGSYYKVVFHLDGAPPSTETWSVPALAETTISAVRATVMPATAAVQVASRAYVDSVLAGKAASGANADITSLALGNGGPWLQRDAADALGVWRGANGQRFSVYNTRSGSASYERLSTFWSGNTAYLRTENAGTGAVRQLLLGAGETPALRLEPGRAVATGVLSADGYLDMSGTGAYAITSDPPAFGGTGVGWKLGLWQNIYALGVANNTIAAKTGKWFSVFSSTPANDATSSAPDSAAGVSLGGDGTLIAGAGTFSRLDKVRMADGFAGADACAKIVAAIADLPATGGTVDARGLGGAQSCAVNPFTGATVPITLLVGKATITSVLGWTVPSNVHVIGLGADKSVLLFQGASAGMTAALSVAAQSNIEIAGLTISSTATNGADRGISGYDATTATSYINIHDCKFTGIGQAGTAPSGEIFFANANDITIRNNEFTANGPAVLSSSGVYDIVFGYYAPYTQDRITIENNYIHANNDAIAVILFDSTNATVRGNVINQNNKSFGSNNDGYGIAIYKTASATNIPAHNVVANNDIQNTAGDGIYLQTSNDTAVTGNSIYNCSQQDSDASLPASCISTNGGTGYSITANTVDTSAWHGIEAGPTRSEVISGNTILNITKQAIKLRSGSDLVVNGNHINGAQFGIYAPGAIVGASIGGNEIAAWGNGGSGAGIGSSAASTDWVVANNILRNPAGAGQGMLFSSASTTRMTFVGNDIIGTITATGIDYRGSFARIIGNHIAGVTSTTSNVGLDLNTATDTIADNNTITGGSGYGIRSNGARNIVRNNLLLNNASGGLSVTNALAVNGNDTDAAGGYDFGGDSGATVATIDLAGKGTFNGGLVIGGGTAIAKHLSATATLDFPNTPAATCSDLTITVAGAALGDTVSLGVPASSVVTGGFFSAWVSAADTVTVRFCALATGNSASGVFRVDVWKH